MKSRIRLCRASTEWLLFLVLAVASTWPAAPLSSTHIPLGTERVPTVPLLNLWTMWWNVDRIEHAYRDYWNAPILFPTPGTFAFSEPQPVTGLLARPLWSVLPDHTRVYTTLLLVYLTLNGWISCQLLKRLRLVWPAAVAGGAMVCLLPLVHQQLGVFQLVALWGVVWTLSALIGLRRRPTFARGLHVGLALAITYLLCSYYGLFLAMLLAGCAPVLFGRQLRSGLFWRSAAAAAVTAVLLVAPVAWTQYRTGRERPVEFAPALLSSLSVVPADYWQTPGAQLVPLPTLARDPGAPIWKLSPGTLKIVCAAIGCVGCLWTRRRRRVALFLCALGAVAMFLAMGPRAQWGAFAPYHWLTEIVPGYQRARNIFRFAFFVQLATVLLAAMGLHLVWVQLVRRSRGKPVRRVAASLAWLLVATVVAVEAWPPATAMYAVPSLARHAGWLGWLAADEQSETRLVFFPLAAGNDVDQLVRTAEWMYFQIEHRRPMANGYTGLAPIEYVQLRDALAAFPDKPGLAALHAAGITHCVLDRSSGANFDPVALEQLGCTLVVDDRHAGMEIWLLPAPQESGTSDSRSRS